MDDQGRNASFTRRTLLQTGAATAVTLALPASALARKHNAKRRVLSHLRRGSYHSLVGQRFRVDGSGVVLRLAKVEDLTHAPKGSENAFALIFRAPSNAPPLPAVPTLHHAALGDFPLLISPGRPSSSGQPYAAIINRIHA